jgi:hypothetical protein
VRPVKAGGRGDGEEGLRCQWIDLTADPPGSSPPPFSAAPNALGKRPHGKGGMTWLEFQITAALLSLFMSKAKVSGPKDSPCPAAGTTLPGVAIAFRGPCQTSLLGDGSPIQYFRRPVSAPL